MTATVQRKGQDFKNSLRERIDGSYSLPLLLPFARPWEFSLHACLSLLVFQEKREGIMNSSVSQVSYRSAIAGEKVEKGGKGKKGLALCRYINCPQNISCYK